MGSECVECVALGSAYVRLCPRHASVDKLEAEVAAWKKAAGNYSMKIVTLRAVNVDLVAALEKIGCGCKPAIRGNSGLEWEAFVCIRCAALRQARGR